MNVYGSIYANGNVTAYIDNALERVTQLTGYTFDRIDTDGPRQTGLIAQDVLEVLPEAVSKADNDSLCLAYGNLAGLFVEAFKEINESLISIKASIANK